MNITSVIPVVLLLSTICSFSQSPSQEVTLNPSTMTRVGRVDERFQSFNVEMVEVTGGRFWRPYSKEVEELLKAPRTGGVVGMDPSLFQQRPSIDLSSRRLRNLASALGPSYVRVSGTWANSTYLQGSEEAGAPPPGFNAVLTRAEWKGVVDFARAVDARIVTSVAISAGTRDDSGVWTPAQARRLLDYTKSLGGSIAAAEFMNEPTFAQIGGAPKGYDAAAYGRDFKVFRAFVKEAAPEMMILGPGSVGEGITLAPGGTIPGQLKSEDLLAAAGADFDAFSYHFYGAISKRSSAGAPAAGTTPEQALSDDWFGRTARVHSFYASLRDRFAAGKPLWLTETADTACGGNPWGSTFLDSFRYLNQLGLLASKGVQVVAHNTLAASDYGLVDENTLAPRPNYWSALLWHRLMGSTVLDPALPSTPGMRVYSHCLVGRPGGVAVLAINTHRTAPKVISIGMQSERYTLTAENLEDHRVKLNGEELNLASEDEVPQTRGVPAKAGPLTLAPASITFLAIPSANNASCR